MRRVAVVDVGTNTALLLVAEVFPDQKLRVLQSHRRFVRLGEGIDQSKNIREAAIDRLLSAMKEFRELVGTVDAVRIVGTSASRDAANIEVVRDAVRVETGWKFEVLTGEEEARFSHSGALAALQPGQYDLRPVAVVDIGGGSTEITLSERGEHTPSYQTSLQLGTVRLTERCVSRQPVSQDEQSIVRLAVQRSLRLAETPVREGLLLVGAAGTARTIAILDGTIDRPGSIDLLEPDFPYFLSRAALGSWRQRLCDSTYEQVLALNSELMLGRADVIPVGALLLEEIAEHLGAEGVLVSPYSLRHGVAMAMSRV